MLVHLVCLLLLCLISSSNAMQNALPVLAKSDAVRNVEIDESLKCAYVFMHYEGTDADDVYVLGLRVLINSVRNSGTKYPMIVLVADNVSQESRDSFTALGAQVREVSNIPNPYKEAMEQRRSYKDRFEFTFNKLYLWDLTEFDRVMYMDSDNIVLYNIDELFLCGHFCAVFMNMIYFHTGLLVVKPDHETFEGLLKALRELDSYSYDGADQGFLTAHFSDMENAPLFRLEDVKNGLPMEAHGMRLGMEYNINHLYYGLHNNWDWLRYMGHYFADYEIPALSICYPIAPVMKPWNWVGTFFIDMQWVFVAFRSTLPGEEYWNQIWFPSRVLAAGMFSVVGYFYIKYGLIHPFMVAIRKRTVTIMMKFSKRTVKVLGLIYGTVICFYYGPMFASYLVPQIVPATVAWPAYMFFRIFFIYLSLETITALSINPQHKIDDLVVPHGLLYALRPPWTIKSMMVPMLFEIITINIGFSNLFPSDSFLPKMIMFTITCFIFLCLEIHMFQVAVEVGYMSELQFKMQQKASRKMGDEPWIEPGNLTVDEVNSIIQDGI